MKIKAQADFVRFLKAVGECSSEILFQTEEGDCLNLKSALSQYVFAMIFSKPELLNSGRICCSDEDLRRLNDFLEI